MARHRHLSGRFGRSRGWRGRLTLTFLLLLAVGLGSVFYLTRPRRLARLTATLLTDMTGAQTTIESARLGGDGTIRLRGVELRVPGLGPEAGRLFAADEAVIKHDVWSLLGGRFRAESLVLIEPTLYLIEDVESGRFNYQVLQDAREDDDDGRDPPKHIPEIIVRAGAMEFGETGADGYTLLGHVRLSGNLTVDPKREHAYYFTLRQEAPDGGAAPTLSGGFDLATLAVQGNAERLVIDSPQRVILPRRWRQWWDRLEPAGAVPEVSFAYDPDPAVGFHAILEVRDVELTLPYGEAPPRLTHVSGRFAVSDDAVEIVGLHGRMDELRYRIDGRVDGFDAQAPFDLRVRVEPFEVTQAPPPWLAHLSQIQKLFQRFSPEGKLRATVRLRRGSPGGRIAYSGEARVWDGKGRYAKFPYPLENVRGDIRFDDSLIELVSIHGDGPTGARVHIKGQVSPPTDGAAVHVEVTATDVPVDALLRDALAEDQRRALDTFLDADAHARLIEAGLIQTSDQLRDGRVELAALTARRDAMAGRASSDAAALWSIEDRIVSLKRSLSRPVFDLGGTIAAHVRLDRPLGPGQKFRTAVTADLAGTGGMFTHWPYPLEVAQGTLRIENKQVFLDGVSLRGLTGARGSVRGTIRRGEHGVEPELELRGEGLPIDALLLASLDERSREWIEKIGLAGSVDLAGRVRREAQGGRIGYRLALGLQDGRARPNGGRFVIDGLAGEALLERGGLTIERMTGRRGDTEVAVAGSVAWGEGEPAVDIGVEARGLAIDAALLDLLPPEGSEREGLAALLDEHRLAGVVDAQVSYRGTGDPEGRGGTEGTGEEPVYHLVVRPAWLDFHARGQDVELRDVEGELIVGGGGITLHDFAAVAGETAFNASGDVRLGERPEIDLIFEAQAPRLDETARLVLPVGVKRVLDALELRGGYRVSDARLIYRDGESVTHDGRAFDFQGRVELIDATASVGVPITGLRGAMDVRASKERTDLWPRLDLRLNLAELEAAERRLTDVTLRIASAESPGVVELRDLQASVYGGTLLGSGTIDMAREARYRLALTLQDARLDPVIHPRAPAATRPGEDPAGGTVSASLTIEGLPDEPDTRRGRGELDVRKATIYEVPVAMALLQVFNLSLPMARAFDRATAQYLLDGDTVRFDSIRLEAPGLEIAGDGTMTYSTQALDLDLYSRNPGALKLGPVSDLLRGVKDELVKIHVGGTLGEPQAEVQSLGGIKKTWQEIFGGEARRAAQAGDARASGQ